MPLYASVPLLCVQIARLVSRAARVPEKAEPRIQTGEAAARAGVDVLQRCPPLQVPAARALPHGLELRRVPRGDAWLLRNRRPSRAVMDTARLSCCSVERY